MEPGVRWTSLAMWVALATGCLGGGGHETDAGAVDLAALEMPRDAGALDGARDPSTPPPVRECWEDPGNCEGMPSTGGTGPDGVGTCLEVLTCVYACRTETCDTWCSRGASTAARGEFRALRACADEHCPTLDGACLRTHCAAAWHACTVQPPPVHQACTELVGCTNACAERDTPYEDCVDACVSTAPANAVQAYEDALDCIYARCPDFDGACQSAECGPQLAACLGPRTDPPAEVATCRQLNACLSGCDTDECANACVDASLSAAVTEYSALLECVDEAACGRGENLTSTWCIEAQCLDELTACFGPVAAPAGLAPCLQTYACFDGCYASPDAPGTCLDDCTAASSPGGFRNFQDLVRCHEANDCWERECADCDRERLACAGPPPNPDPSDGGPTDAGPTDAGLTDAGPTDASDAGSPEPNPPDAGTPGPMP